MIGGADTRASDQSSLFSVERLVTALVRQTLLSVPRVMYSEVSPVEHVWAPITIGFSTAEKLGDGEYEPQLTPPAKSQNAPDCVTVTADATLGSIIFAGVGGKL